jgi:hypothetical protein
MREATVLPLTADARPGTVDARLVQIPVTDAADLAVGRVGPALELAQERVTGAAVGGTATGRQDDIMQIAGARTGGSRVAPPRAAIAPEGAIVIVDRQPQAVQGQGRNAKNDRAVPATALPTMAAGRLSVRCEATIDRLLAIGRLAIMIGVLRGATIDRVLGIVHREVPIVVRHVVVAVLVLGIVRSAARRTGPAMARIVRSAAATAGRIPAAVVQQEPLAATALAAAMIGGPRAQVIGPVLEPIDRETTAIARLVQTIGVRRGAMTVHVTIDRVLVATGVVRPPAAPDPVLGTARQVAEAVRSVPRTAAFRPVPSGMPIEQIASARRRKSTKRPVAHARAAAPRLQSRRMLIRNCSTRRLDRSCGR